MDFKKMREIRKAAKMSQEDLAQAMGVNRATISKYETGAIEPSLAQLTKAAYILNVDIADLMGGYQYFDSGEEFNAAWKKITAQANCDNSQVQEVTVAHKSGGGVQIIDHQKERLDRIYERLDQGRQANLVKYGEFLLQDLEGE